MKFIDSYLKEANKILENINNNQIKKVINKIAEIKKRKNFFLVWEEVLQMPHMQ